MLLFVVDELPLLLFDEGFMGVVPEVVLLEVEVFEGVLGGVVIGIVTQSEIVDDVTAAINPVLHPQSGGKRFAPLQDKH